MMRLLARVIGVGIETADMLVHEVLSRNMRDRRAVARYAGLTGSPKREREAPPGERAGPFGQCSGSTRHDPIGVAVPSAPEEQRFELGFALMMRCRQKVRGTIWFRAACDPDPKRPVGAPNDAIVCASSCALMLGALAPPAVGSEISVKPSPSLGVKFPVPTILILSVVPVTGSVTVNKPLANVTLGPTALSAWPRRISITFGCWFVPDKRRQLPVSNIN